MASRMQILITSGLVAATAWSGIFALAAVTGLGGRHTTLADDPSLVPPLPEVNLEQAVSRLEGQGFYAEIGDRPLFNFDRRPLPPVRAPESQVAEAAPPASFDLVLTSVLMSGDRKIAIVLHPPSGKSQSVQLGNELEADLAGWRLVEIQPRAAIFEGPGGRKSVDMRVFDGTGGQPPTPVDLPPHMQASQNAAPGPGEPTDAQTLAAGQNNASAQGAAPDSPEARAEMIRRRIEERRRQMREEAERARQ
jgi:general secretion pathway protein N